MGFWEIKERELALMRGAPISCVIIMGVGLTAGYFIASQLYAREIANLHSEIELKDGRIDSYQKSINERLEKVERELSAQQLSDIKSKLQTQTGNVIIEGGDIKKDARANQLKDVFTDSGWQVETKPAPGDKSAVILRTQEGKDASTIEQALKHAGVDYEAVPANGKTNFKLGVPKM